MHEKLVGCFVDRPHEHFFAGIAAKQVADSRRRDIQRLARLPIKLHFDGPLTATKHLHTGHTIDILQLRHHLLVHDIPHPVYPSRAPHLKSHEGVTHHGYVHLLHAHVEAIRKRGRHLFHLLFQSQRSSFKVHGTLEIDTNRRLSAADLRHDLLYPSHGADGPFQGNNHLRFHVAGVHILWRADRHVQHGQLRVGEQFNR